MMDYAEWFASADAAAMLGYLYPLPGPHSTHEHTRLGRLYLAACVRRQWAYLPWPCRRLIEVAEEFADHPPRAGVAVALTPLAESLPGRAGTPDDWAELTEAVRAIAGGTPDSDHRPFHGDDHWEQTARLISFLYYHETPPYQQIRAAYHRPEYVRDLFAAVLRRVRFDPAWRTDAAVGLAGAAYDAGAFDRLPILADALEEAGCDVPAVLDHCRGGTTPHVRGCWVVDLVLGKA
jgi:hypothetical protein